MKFGIYIHIPYCLQRCPYCDFATYKHDQILPQQDYLQLLNTEITFRTLSVPFRDVHTIYFGGGTPSLLDPKDILSILTHLAKQGFNINSQTEITIEANPGTINEKKLFGYLENGVNRVSVGAQTFSERLLKVAGRKHSTNDTKQLLSLLHKNKINFNLDILFALPTQTLSELQSDIATALEFHPPHVSPYCLTLPSHHPMQVGRPAEDTELGMFAAIDDSLAAHGYVQYEISNYAKPGFESQHNTLYWTDDSYWGVGLSSHSYFNLSPWGIRFWNAKSIEEYTKQASLSDFLNFEKDGSLPKDQYEVLEQHQSLTDYCHTSLRTAKGLAQGALRCKFGEGVVNLVGKRIEPLMNDGFIEFSDDSWRLSKKGKLLSNVVFPHILFTSSCLNEIRE